MKDLFENYIQAVTSKFSYEETSEMGYRSDLEIVLKGVFSSINNSHIFHDPKASQGNKPDFIVLKDKIPLLYIEAKNIGESLDKIEKSNQMSRYFGYANLILTDYAEFRFYRNGEPYGKPIQIADYDVKSRTITPKPENYEYLAKTLLDFTKSHKEPIKSGKHLAKIMGGKAQRIRDNIREILASEAGKDSELMNVYETIKRLLVQDLTTDSFADMYAQTLVYGLFVARFHDQSLGSFSRQEARDLIPASNPFLGHFFDHIAGRNFEKRLSYIVDELCEVFTHANVAGLMEQHFKSAGKGTQREQDQVVHFYEDFLKEYDDALRKKMGAYYTPLPVVQFIVRSVDYLLEEEFGLADGLANTSRTKDNIHKVQILDPAVGTGTFISDIIGKIYKRLKEDGQEGRWPGYVHYSLLPRLHGFELMMAPYTIAHLKLSLALKKTGFKEFFQTSKGKARLGIYLTNSLEGVSKQPELLAFDFGASIAEEAKAAAKIKNEKPIMVVVGNPPYSISSSNKGTWIQDLIRVYKRGLNEQNSNSLSDDYVKFIRLAEHLVEKNNIGIVAMITNNAFLDGITHRIMRKHLLQTFDTIHILNLHGSLKRRNESSTNIKDENIFDIQQGVSINIFVRREEYKSGLGKVYHADVYGKRVEKFDVLNKSSLKSIKWQELNYSEPYYFFVPKNFELDNEYNKGFTLNSLFLESGSGIKFRKDNLLVKKHFTSKSVKELLEDINNLDDNTLHSKYDFKDTTDWNLPDMKKFFHAEDYQNIKSVQYRPFDIRFTYYPLDRISKIIPRGDSRKNLMKNLLHPNISLITSRQYGGGEHFICFCTKYITEISSQPYAPYHISPLYLYNEDGTKTPNLKSEIVDEIEKIVGKVSPEDIFDYIYAVLHSPSYREKYKEFLKIDFPRIPYPKDKKTFKELVKLGGELRSLHLLESPKVDKFITTYPISGSDTVEKIEYKDGNVWINNEQYFGNVPEVAKNLYIGGYQPAQKWLKDRKGRVLTNADIEHYQKIIVILTETDRIMKEVDKTQ